MRAASAKTHLAELTIYLRCDLCIGVNKNGTCELLLSVTALMRRGAIKFKSFTVCCFRVYHGFHEFSLSVCIVSFFSSCKNFFLGITSAPNDCKCGESTWQSISFIPFVSR